jgi:hypothetical protein
MTDFPIWSRVRTLYTEPPAPQWAAPRDDACPTEYRSAAPPPPSRGKDRAALTGVMALLGLNAGAFLVGAWVLTRFPFELNYGEGIVLWQADRVFRLPEAYHPIQEYPYTVFHYPPLYHMLTRLAELATGDLLTAGRLVAWLSALAMALLVGAIVYVGTVGRTPSRVTGAVSAALLVFHLPTISWVPYMRVDATAMLFALAGLCLFLRFRSAWGCALAGVAFVAALFTKQSMISGPAAVGVVLLLAGQFRNAAVLVAVMGILGATVACALTVATAGEFLRHTVLYNANPFSVGQLVKYMGWDLVTMNVILLLALALPVMMLAARRGGNPVRIEARMLDPRAVWTVVLYGVVALVVSFSAGKLGASKNYFLEWNVVCCIAAGFLVAVALGSSGHWRRAPASTAVIVMLAVAGVLGLASTLRQWRIVNGHDLVMNLVANGARRALVEIQATRGRVFSDDMTLLRMAGREVPWEPAIVTVLAATGAWDERPIVAMVTRGQFDTIVVRYLDNPLFFSRAVHAAIVGSYADTGIRAGHYRILRRRDAPR